MSDPFDIFIIAIILINTVFLAVEHEDMGEKLTSVLDWGNTIFTFMFAAEMILKLIGLGFCGYLREGFNVFDGLIVILSLLEYS